MLPRILTLSPLAAALLLGACKDNVVRAPLTPDRVGTRHARLTGYFAACAVDCVAEDTPGQLRRELVRDEVLVRSLARGETCFDAVIRTESGLDEALEQLSPRCELDGAEERAFVDGEQVTITDYTYDGRSETVRVGGVASSELFALSLSEPAALTFRVVERRASLCCAGTPRRELSLTLHNPQLDVGATDAVLTTTWDLR